LLFDKTLAVTGKSTKVFLPSVDSTICVIYTAGDADFNNVDIAALGGLLKLYLVC